MNYQRIHDQIIDCAKTRTLPSDTYIEKHHIIPRSLGGSNSKNNLVKLTAREHYIIHWLLYKIHRTAKLAHAWNSMCMRTMDMPQRYTSHSFRFAREHFSQIHKDIWSNDDYRNKMIKKRIAQATPEIRKKISSSVQALWNDPEYRKMQTLNKTGKKQSAEHIERKVVTLRGIPRTDETRQKISKSKLGHIVSDETRAKIKNSMTPAVINKMLYSRRINTLKKTFIGFT